MRVECPHCGYSADYTPEQMEIEHPCPGCTRLSVPQKVLDAKAEKERQERMTVVNFVPNTKPHVYILILAPVAFAIIFGLIYASVEDDWGSAKNYSTLTTFTIIYGSAYSLYLISYFTIVISSILKHVSSIHSIARQKAEAEGYAIQEIE
jgi:hypothetical protein